MYREIFLKCVYFRLSFCILKKKNFKVWWYSWYWCILKKKCVGYVEFVNNFKYEREMFLFSLV